MYNAKSEYCYKWKVYSNNTEYGSLCLSEYYDDRDWEDLFERFAKKVHECTQSDSRDMVKYKVKYNIIGRYRNRIAKLPQPQMAEGVKF